MHSCAIWGLGLALGWIAILAWHGQGGEPDLLVNGITYGVVGIFALGLVGRCAKEWHPAFKRISALLACVVLSGVDVGLSGYRGEAGQKLFFASLLGIALVVLVARHSPAGLRRCWLGEG